MRPAPVAEALRLLEADADQVHEPVADRAVAAVVVGVPERVREPAQHALRRAKVQVVALRQHHALRPHYRVCNALVCIYAWVIGTAIIMQALLGCWERPGKR